MNLREWLPRHAVDRPVTVLMAFVACLVIGLIAYVRIPVQMMPGGFDPGFLWIWVPYPDASPTEVDEQLVRPIQAQLATVSGVAQLQSRASSGSASFSLELHGSVDMDDAYDTVVDRLERAMVDLPDDVERYGVFRYNPSDEPVIWAGVQLSEEVEDPYFVMTRVVQPRIERIAGVASMDVWGVPRRGIWIDYDKQRTYAHGVNLGEVQRRLGSDNFQMASGRIEDRGLLRHARSISTVTGVDDLRRFPVKDGVFLEDIADVQMRAAYSADINRVMGEEAAALAIRKESGANAVDVAHAVEAAFRELEADPRAEGASFFVFFSQGKLIEDSVGNLRDSALIGGLFAIFILYAFLREWRMTMLIAASIPFSLLLTVGALYFRGQSLNLLSLMGLMLAVGMVVDNAIVVVETVYRRRAEGAGARAAAIGGTGEVGLAIVSSTLTTMVVFLPVILMSENAQFSFFMGVLGMPVVYALAASLIVALIFAPLATRYMRSAEIKADPRWLAWLGARYTRLLRWVVGHRVDAAVGLLAMGLLTFTVAIPGVQCVDSADGNINDFTVRFSVPPQASLADRDDIVRAFEEMVEAHREAWGVRVYRSRLEADDHEGRLYVYLEDDGPMEREQVMDAALAAMPEIPGVRGRIGWQDDGAGGGSSITLEITGDDVGTLHALAEEVGRRVRPVDGVMAVHLDVASEGADEIRLYVEREAAARYGVPASQVGNTVAWAMRGTSLPDVRDGEKEVAVTSRFELDDRDELDDILDFELWSNTLQRLVPVRTVTRMEVGKGPDTIRRSEGITSTSLTIDLEEGALAPDVYGGIDAALADMVFPRGYGWSKGRSFQQRGEEDAAMQLALLLSVAFVFLLIGMLFESWVLPLSIVTTIPMAMMGALWGLYLSGTAMDTMAGVGLVILVGVVVNNGIVLVDLITQLRGEGMDRDEALVEAGSRRLRPILMTALTTICGLLPMALGSSSFIGIPYAPLGRTVIGGMVAGTVLTLLFVPYLYSLLDDARNGAVRWWALVRGAS